MYDTGLTPGHTTVEYDPMYLSVNEAPIIIGGFDGESYNDYHGVGLQFDWSHDIRYFFRTGLIKYGL